LIPSKPNIKTTNKTVTAINFVLIDKLITSFTFLNYNIYRLIFAINSAFKLLILSLKLHPIRKLSRICSY